MQNALILVMNLTSVFWQIDQTPYREFLIPTTLHTCLEFFRVLFFEGPIITGPLLQLWIFVLVRSPVITGSTLHTSSQTKGDLSPLILRQREKS